METAGRIRVFTSVGAFTAIAAIGVLCAQLSPVDEERLWGYRNLGKAFYENPTTQKQAVDEFRKARDLAPGSAREILNYGLALLRAGDAPGGIAELEKAQKLDAALPHTWFNLGIALKRQGEFDTALPQLREFARLAPDDAAVHYQLGSLYKAKGDMGAAQKEFETARDLNPRLAAPHFQLYGIYRQLTRTEDAARELLRFQELKKQQEGAAVPEDMEWNFYSEIYDPPPGESSAVASAPVAAAVYRDQKIGSGFAGAAVLNVDGGTRPSLIAWGSAGAKLFRNGVQAVAASGLEDLRDVVFIAPGDFDNDGLPDLCVVTTQAALLYRNVNGRFQKQKELARGAFRKAIWVDYDHDYDADLVLLGDDQRLLRNNGAAGFSDESARFPFVRERALDGVRFDVEPDTQGFDLAVSYADRPGVLYRDRLGGTYQALDLPELPAGATGLVAGDVNHDGRTDLAARSPSMLLVNRAGGFRAAEAPKVTEFPFVQPVDFDGKGKGDRAWVDKTTVDSDGVLYLGRNVTPAYGNWIEIALTGVKNAKLSVGAQVEVKAGSTYRKVSYEGVPVVVRIGAHALVDTVRITWPNGLIQNEPRQAVNRVSAIKEAPRLSGSCPMIFTWNGERFQFITDVLGVAPLGASSGDGQYFPVDHDEYVSIPGEALKQRAGEYEIRVTEELREVSYIDQIRLLALDHPAGVDVVTNEKFKSPPFPEFRLFGVERRIHPVTARDQKGADVRAALAKRDGVYPDSFRRDQAGVAEMHTIDLDFGEAAQGNQAVLILSGWVDWADGSTFLAAMQERKDLTFPYLQVKDAAGKWRTVVEDMGIPAGKPKTIAVDLGGKFLSASREVRIVTNLCVYWDEIYLAESNRAPASRITPVEMISADLNFRGFSRATIDAGRKQPEGFDYQAVSAISMWNPTPGNYTRYGAVEKLLAEPDDRMVVMGSGDEIRLRFRAGLPEPPLGWKRDFLLLVDGWAKDADANTAYSQSILPLPFHGMSRYPYPAAEHFPDDREHVQYEREYNTRPALRLIRGLSGVRRTD